MPRCMCPHCEVITADERQTGTEICADDSTDVERDRSTKPPHCSLFLLLFTSAVLHRTTFIQLIVMS